MTSIMLSAASRPTLAENARTRHPRFVMGKEEQSVEKGGPHRLKDSPSSTDLLESFLKEERRLGLQVMFWLLVVVLVCSFVVIPLFQWTGRKLGAHIAQTILASVVLATGVGAHWFKRKHKGWYGVTEIIFGSVLAFRVTLAMSIGQAVLSQWTALIGCAYVIARGLNKCIGSSSCLENLSGGAV